MAHDIVSMLEFEEGRRRTAYPDPNTHGDPWTIGVGHTGPGVHEGLVWDDEQITRQRDTDIAGATALCHRLPWFDHVDPVRQAVLIGMAFQLGARLFTFHNTLAAVRDGRYDHAAVDMRLSLWATQTPKRVARMARQMETGQWQ